MHTEKQSYCKVGSYCPKRLDTKIEAILGTTCSLISFFPLWLHSPVPYALPLITLSDTYKITLSQNRSIFLKQAQRCKMTGWGHKECILLVFLDCAYHPQSFSTTPTKSTNEYCLDL